VGQNQAKSQHKIVSAIFSMDIKSHGCMYLNLKSKRLFKLNIRKINYLTTHMHEESIFHTNHNRFNSLLKPSEGRA